MLKSTVFALLMPMAIFCCKTAFSCEAIDSSFEPTGLIVLSTTNGFQAIGRLAYLGDMLDAKYQKKVGDLMIQSVHLSVDNKTQKFVISYELETKLQGPRFGYDVVCIGDEWGYSKSRKFFAEGLYREYEIKFRVKELPDGSMEVRNEYDITNGLIFKDNQLYLVTARFSKVGVRPTADK